jgi:hypothetical protein
MTRRQMHKPTPDPADILPQGGATFGTADDAFNWLRVRGGAGTIDDNGTVIAHTDKSPPDRDVWEALHKAGRVEIDGERIKVIGC